MPFRILWILRFQKFWVVKTSGIHLVCQQRMKKLFLILITASIAGLSIADFQSPPAEKYSRIRKLSRAVSNLVLGVTELPNQWERSNRLSNNTEAVSYGTLWAAHKIVTRVGYGLYELLTFPVPSYKGGFRQPYYLKESTHPYRGYQEFPVEVGFISGTINTRDQED